MKKTKQYGIMSLLFMVCVSITLIMTSVDSKAAGLTESTATDISNQIMSGTAVSGYMQNDGEEHWYVFTKSSELSTYRFRIGTSETIGDAVNFSVKEKNGLVIHKGYYLGASEEQALKLKPSTEYVICVQADCWDSFQYSFNCLREADEPDYRENAQAITLDNPQQGNISVCTDSQGFDDMEPSEKWDVDWFRFTTNSMYDAYKISVSAPTMSSSIDMAVYDAYGNKIVGGFYSYGEKVNRYLKLQKNSTYYICIYTDEWNEGKIQYVFDVKPQEYSFDWNILDKDATCNITLRNVSNQLEQHTESMDCRLDEYREATTAQEGIKSFIASWTDVGVSASSAFSDTYEIKMSKLTSSDTLLCGTHSWGKWMVEKKPTVISSGSQKRSCKNCGYTEYKTVKKLTLKYTIRKKKTTKITIGNLPKGDSVKSIKFTSKAKVNVKKVKKNQYKLTPKKRGTYNATVKLKSGKQFKIKFIVK